MAKIDKLEVDVTADISDLNRKMDEVVGKVDGSVGKMSGAFSHLNTGVGKVATGLGAFGLAIEGAKAALAPFVGLMDQLNESSGILRTSNRLGVATEKFQEFTFAARTFGATSEDVSDVIKDFGIRVGEAAEGAEGMKIALSRIGLEAAELIKLSPEQQFEALADAVRDSRADLARLSLDELVSDPGIRMIEVLNLGSDGLKQMAEEARELNVVLSESELDNMAQAAKDVEKLKAAFEGLLNEVIVELAPLMKEFLSATLTGVKELNKFLGLNLDKAEQIKAKQEELREVEAKIGRMRARDNTILLENERKRLLDEILALQISIGKEEEKKAERREASGGGGGGGSVNDLFKEAFDNQESGLNLGNFRGEDGGDEGETPSLVQSYLGPEEETMDLLAQNLELFKEHEQTLILQRIAFNDAINSEDERAQEYNRQLWESGWRGKQRVMSNTLGQMSTLMNSESRKMFEVGKAAAIAQVAVDTPKAAMSAYSAMAGIPYIGPILGAAAAAAAIATGVSQINQIKGQSFGGGSGGGGGAIDGGGGAAGAEPQEVVQTTNFDVTLQGDNFSGEQVRGLIGAINDETDDNVKLNAVMAG